MGLAAVPRDRCETYEAGGLGVLETPELWRLHDEHVCGHLADALRMLVKGDVEPLAQVRVCVAQRFEASIDRFDVAVDLAQPLSKLTLDEGRDGDDAAFGGATSVEPKTISPTDPAARYTASANAVAGYAYSDNYLVDLKHAVIMDVEATTAIRQAEVSAANDDAGPHVASNSSTWTCHALVAQMGATARPSMVGWLVDERGIEPHVNLIDKSGARRTELSPASQLHIRYRNATSHGSVPEVCELRKYRRAFSAPREGVAKDGAIRYRAAQYDCDACALKPKCCPNVPARKIARSVYTMKPLVTRPVRSPRPRPTPSHAGNERTSRCSSLIWKRILRLDRLRLRGPSGAKDEFLLAATAQNLQESWRSSFRSRRPSSPHEANSQESRLADIATNPGRYASEQRVLQQNPSTPDERGADLPPAFSTRGNLAHRQLSRRRTKHAASQSRFPFVGLCNYQQLKVASCRGGSSLPTSSRRTAFPRWVLRGEARKVATYH